MWSRHWATVPSDISYWFCLKKVWRLCSCILSKSSRPFLVSAWMCSFSHTFPFGSHFSPLAKQRIGLVIPIIRQWVAIAKRRTIEKTVSIKLSFSIDQFSLAIPVLSALPSRMYLSSPFLPTLKLSLNWERHYSRKLDHQIQRERVAQSNSGWDFAQLGLSPLPVVSLLINKAAVNTWGS